MIITVDVYWFADAMIKCMTTVIDSPVAGCRNNLGHMTCQNNAQSSSSSLKDASKILHLDVL